MKRIIYLFAFIFLYTYQDCLAQTQTIGLNSYFGAATTDKFTYENKELGNYSLGWYQTPNAAEFRLSGYDGIRLFTNRMPRLFIHKLGNVGIGTVDPEYKLHINGSLYAAIPSTNTAGVYAQKIINFSTANGSQHGMYLQVESGGGYLLKSSIDGGASQDAFNINNYGSMGLGTDKPKAKLDIVAKGDNDDLLRLSHPTSPAAAGFIMGFGTNPEGSANSAVDFKVNYASNTYNILQIDRINQNFSFIGAGNLGIGTDSPNALLDIKAKTNNQDLLRLSHPTAPDAASFSMGFGTNSANSDNYAVDFNVEFSNTKYKVLQIDRATRDFYYVGDGRLGVGTSTPDKKLTVVGDAHITGTINTTEVVVNTAAASVPDYVFQPTYKLRSLAEVKSYVQANSHLPEVPSAQEIEADGLELAKMNLILLKKIEELTLYQIELMEQLQQQSAAIDQLKQQMNEQK